MIKDELGKLGIFRLQQLENKARAFYDSLSSQEKKELMDQFRNQTQEEGFDDLVDDCYTEIEEDFQHDDSNDSGGKS